MRNLVTGEEDLLVPVQLPASKPGNQCDPTTNQTPDSQAQIDTMQSQAHIRSTLPTVWSSRWIVSVAAFSIFVSLTHDTLQRFCIAASVAEGAGTATLQRPGMLASHRDRD